MNMEPESQAAAPAATSATRPFYWSVRRELWENRSIYIAPVGVAAVLLFGFSISLTKPAHLRAALNPMQQQTMLQQPYSLAALLIMGTAFLVGVFYSLDTLYGERRDRSILFWKSLPVSDLTTVLAKASIPIVILPLLSFVLTVVTQLIMLLLTSAVMMVSGLDVATLWRQVPLFHMSLMLLYHLVTVHGIWYAPIFAWLLLVSAWARRAAFLWAVLPPLAIGVVERIAFNTSHFANLLGRRMAGPEALSIKGSSMDPMAHADPGQFLSAPGLWIGLVLAAVFIAMAVRLRRLRDPI
ncbi:MAG TPA: ABC transporter permease [Thermoanaerobaculia bacterium]|jgi:ABC-2 type transport system permease protein|nr:ABC transporter permease [Thermoanaerobaculia bacterium]